MGYDFWTVHTVRDRDAVTQFGQWRMCRLFSLLLSHVSRMIGVSLAASDTRRSDELRTMFPLCTRCPPLAPRAPFARPSGRRRVRRRPRFEQCTLSTQSTMCGLFERRRQCRRWITVDSGVRNVRPSRRSNTRSRRSPQSTPCTQCRPFRTFGPSPTSRRPPTSGRFPTSGRSTRFERLSARARTRRRRYPK